MMPWEKAAAAKAKAVDAPLVQNGMERALAAFGLGEVITAAKQMADAGTVAKIMAFADALPQIIERLERLEIDVNDCAKSLAILSGRRDDHLLGPEHFASGPRGGDPVDIAPGPDRGTDGGTADHAGTPGHSEPRRQRRTREPSRVDADV
jgi:hypothetical protein